MEKILGIFHSPDMTREKYDSVIKDLDNSGLYKVKARSQHTMALNGKGCVIIDVWDSNEALNEFFGTLGPILVKNGVNPPKPEIYPVYNQIS